MTAAAAEETVTGWGHVNIQAVHPATLMLTKEAHLSQTGDCIVAVAADKAAADLSEAFKAALRKPGAKLSITIEAGGLKEQIRASGSPKLILTHPSDLVVRKSAFISDRTLAVHADKASSDLPRELVEKLNNPNQKIKVTLAVSF